MLQMEAVIYARWSSDDQGKGSTLSRQREYCFAMAEAHGWKVVEEIVDDGISAFRGAHADIGALGRFIRAVEDGAYPDGVVLLVERLDRLSREAPEIAFSAMMRMTGAGVVIATVDGNRQYRTGKFGMAEIIEIIVKAQLSYEESAKKSERVGHAWAKKRERLTRGDMSILTLRAPAWLQVEGDPPQFVVNEDRAKLVRRIFEMSLKGMGQHSVARLLNQEKVPTFGKASAWHSSSVQKILTSEAVIGTFQPHTKPKGGKREVAGDRIDGYFPAIVDVGLHARVIASRKARSRKVRGRGRRLTNIFSGLAICEKCGSRMTLRAKGRKTRADGAIVHEDYLVCDSYQRGTGCENGYHWNLAMWGDAILELILDHAFEDRHFVPAAVAREVESRIAKAERSLAASETRANTALELYISSQRAEPKKLWERLVIEGDELRSKLERLRVELVKARGAVSSEEHQARVAALRRSMEDPDEEVRFEARSRVMQALGELISGLQFFSDPKAVLIDMRTGWATYIMETQFVNGVFDQHNED